MDASRKIPGSIHDEKLIIQFKYRVSRKLGTYHRANAGTGLFKLALYQIWGSRVEAKLPELMKNTA